MTDLALRIERGYAALSPQEQRAADFMREHLDDLAVYNATEVASLSGVSKATISRLYRRLGFDSAEQLRDHVRGLRGAPRAITGTDFEAHLEHEIANLRSALSGLILDEPARLIAGARRVLVIGYRNSYPVALHLRQQLAQARDGVELAPLPGQSIAEELTSLGRDDVVVLVGFRRRPASFAPLVGALAAIPTVLLTDPTGRRYARDVTHLIECPVDTVSAFDSYAAAASVVTLLASAVLGLRSRVNDVSERFAALDELES
ncbi:MAG: RpiR family transcriptional regulator [Microbacteriaceae bacterium]|nr:RpiR family transcriptional regulator [Microbacteriaceae bacterium]